MSWRPAAFKHSVTRDKPSGPAPVPGRTEARRTHGAVRRAETSVSIRIGTTSLLHTAIGKVRRYDGAIYIVTEEGESGVVLYGPYSVLWPGSYEVEFYAMPQELSNELCCVVDVLRRGHSIAAEKISLPAN